MFGDGVSAHSVQFELKCQGAAGTLPHEPIKANPQSTVRWPTVFGELQILMMLPVLWDCLHFTLLPKIEQDAQNTRLENESLNERSIFLWGGGVYTVTGGGVLCTGNPEVCLHGSRNGRGHRVHRCGQPHPPGDCPGLHQGFLSTFLSHSCWP